ncbi:hypothetical protein NAF17_14125 [Mucilaginibacter sp. RB4R14]|uniref:hypothetical protein n=1 Tax=Mucilaginibacter aurantiaciroseus TaxID=2949308 RepID=UPI002090054F|nr:hypothetical protein [Mucilaginibacter aurantiaciroseus]MCO5936678.1 hypothetical protein [Mucilaginibacter aurantiaciroseus]
MTIQFPEKEEAKGTVYLTTYFRMSEFYGLIGLSIGVTITVNAHRYFNEPYFV